MCHSLLRVTVSPVTLKPVPPASLASSFGLNLNSGRLVCGSVWRALGTWFLNQIVRTNGFRSSLTSTDVWQRIYGFGRTILSSGFSVCKRTVWLGQTLSDSRDHDCQSLTPHSFCLRRKFAQSKAFCSRCTCSVGGTLQSSDLLRLLS